VNEDRASRYHRLKRRAALLSLVLTAALLASLLLTGASVWLRDAATVGGQPLSPATLAIYVLFVALLHEAVAFPVAFYRSFLLERRYGLSHEPARAWFKDHAKASLLGAALGLVAAEVVYLTIRIWPRGWWVAAAIALTAAIMILTRLTPTVLLPMFYRFTPLERESLRARLMDLSARAGVRVLGVYEWGLGEKTRRANAALVGSGATRRILLSDTLLAEYSEDEIEVILAHELAHHVHRDIPKALAVEFLLLLVGLWAASTALARGWEPLGLSGPSDPAALPLLLLIGGSATLVATPFINALSRLNERRADRYALKLTGQGGAFISAMRRLGTQNLAEERPSRLALWLFHTHPPIEDRIREARKTTG
jgi:STE24 endopeptidase